MQAACNFKLMHFTILELYSIIYLWGKFLHKKIHAGKLQFLEPFVSICKEIFPYIHFISKYAIYPYLMRTRAEALGSLQYHISWFTYLDMTISHNLFLINWIQGRVTVKQLHQWQLLYLYRFTVLHYNNRFQQTHDAAD